MVENGNEDDEDGEEDGILGTGRGRSAEKQSREQR